MSEPPRPLAPPPPPLAPLPAPPIRIDDLDDPRIAVFRAVKERDRVGREGVLIAEGATVLAVLLRSPLSRIAILVEEGRAARLEMLAERADTPLYVAPQSLLDAIAGFALHRGILAAARIPPPASLTSVIPPDGPCRVPVLVGLSNHDNVGGVYRNAAAFGAPCVVIDRGTADPFYRKAIRVGVGAPLIVPTVRMALGEALQALVAAHITVYALTPSAHRTMGAAPLAPRAAFLLGTEGGGLPREAINAAKPLAIDMAGALDSLNVAAASAIALHAHLSQSLRSSTAV